ncbi:rRNA maturation RNase YbeY [Acidithiobacillus montserratensis]|uniref:rRNA maturation RNase YbeY n=1 Tax=Acidithiobacillus montserratensis TaxID=2729135 RepID=A0ACD5HDQ7_9PROT|nr:rRNA maturation RNase YbeY [Acidithiobacillus montserratensis]MBN2678772.1 rRNA maturation RNase YbeY [Acidithiobacillaceae bacterium]MBU2747942.1 rRNA maturation RNase YbeY [Acidithiobacillus montserratensis]
MSRLYLRIAVDGAVAEAAIPSRQQAREAILRALSVASPRLADPQRMVEVSLALVSNAEIAALNDQYRQRQQPTNCLSFPQDPLPPVFRRDLLGDIVIAPDVVIGEAADQGKPLMHHYRHLLIHSTLHLLGFDHIDEQEALIMEQLETRLLAEMGVADPYLNHVHE